MFQVYWPCIMMFVGYNALVNLVILDMEEVNITLGMSWLSLFVPFLILIIRLSL